jgi:hypothetical protein
VLSFYLVTGGLLGLAAIAAVILLTGLILRNPLAPVWLHNEAVATGAGLVLTIGVCLAVAYAVSGLEVAALPSWAIGILVVVVPAATTFALWTAFSIGERLARTESGSSPFRHAQPPAATKTTPGQVAGPI